HLLVVADLPSAGALRELAASRPRTELLLALERPPATRPSAQRAPLLLALGAGGLGRGALTSATTRIDALVTAADLAPTVLRWLGRRGPAAFTGQAIGVGAARSPGWYRSFAARLAVIRGRREGVLAAFAAAWALLLAASLALRRRAAPALRLGALAALWAPALALLTAALAPDAAAESAIIVGGSFAAALATDRAVAWPRSAALPVAAVLALFTVDLARGSPLTDRSLIGPDPIAGNRFFGAGNELAALLPVALLTGVAAALPQRPPTRREIALLALAGAALTAVLAWGRMGANVGAIMTAGAATAASCVLLAGPTRRRLALAVLAPIAALGALALLDLATGGGAQFTREVLHAHSLGALLATLGRRLREAWSALSPGLVLPATAVLLGAVAVALRPGTRVFEPLADASAWPAALRGALAGSLLGALAADSGPRVLLVGCAMLACAIAYVRGGPVVTSSYRTLSGTRNTRTRVRHPPAGPALFPRRRDNLDDE
ncbi:MAG TPA: hypothetical protein VL977_02060, partial [Solirubrobacteraceae bacterium]|nr:hypothetical protein [Solirubrobacteraceae bacterium]